MDLLQLAKDGLELIKRLQPYLDQADQTLRHIVSIGTSAGMVLQQGKRLYTYLLGKRVAAGNERQTIATTAPTEDAPTEDTPSIDPKDDVAIIIDINQRTLLSVARYLTAQQIDANIIIVTNDAAYSERAQFLAVDDPTEWTEIVKEFHNAILTIRRYVGPVRWHFFLSTPLPLAFGLGSVFGTVDNATVYHWQNNEYHPVVHISRDLRQ